METDSIGVGYQNVDDLTMPPVLTVTLATGLPPRKGNMANSARPL